MNAQPRRRARLLALALATALMVVGQALTWILLRSQGNTLGGDQAHYLIAGQAIRHLTLHPLGQYLQDFRTHFIYAWPKGASITNHAIVQTFPGPHGSVFAHGLGLPLLLSPFLAVGSVPLALLGMFTLTALGVVCIHQRASQLADLGRPARVVFTLLLASPALWLAATQVYPDLLSGILLAMALIEMAHIERSRAITATNAIVIAGALAFVPWLQIKNLAPAVIAVLALGALSFRRRDQRRALIAMGAAIAATWILLAVYNQYYFSDLVGLPQPHPQFTLTTAARTLALLFDAHQGLLVQVPTVVVGLVGLWVGRRTAPWAIGAAVLGALAMVAINGTYTSDVPFGGTAFAGRFEWTAVPMLLAWAPLCLAAFQRSRVRLAAVAAVTAVLWLFEGVPVLRDDHAYVNAMIAPFTPWDPTLYPGWWPLVGRFLPTFLPPGLHLAATWTHLLAELLVLVMAAVVLLWLVKAAPIRRPRAFLVPAALAVAAVVVLAAGPTRTQPAGTLSFPGFGTSQATAGGGTPAPVTLGTVAMADVGPGTYRVTVSYATAPGSQPALLFLMANPTQPPVVAHWFTPHHPTDAALLQVSAPTVAPGSGDLTRARLAAVQQRTTKVVTVHVAHQSLLSYTMTLHGASTYTLTLTLAKVS